MVKNVIIAALVVICSLLSLSLYWGLRHQKDYYRERLDQATYLINYMNELNSQNEVKFNESSQFIKEYTQQSNHILFKMNSNAPLSGSFTENGFYLELDTLGNVQYIGWYKP